ncbi:MAG: RNA polymerase sigma factor [Planctomycetota bacterium]|nr:RNA polymerase sigma factor [Planctomycetota bacterium]
MTKLAEGALIDTFRRGNREAFTELFESNQRRVFRLALHVLHHEEAANDVVQEVFIRAYEELPEWRGEARFSTWLYRTTLNVCFERIRSEDRQRRIRDRQAQEVPHHAPESNAIAGEALRAIERAVKRLPRQQRMIFILKQYDELRFNDIARKLEITEGGAKASYHKALMALRGMLRQWAPGAAMAASA